jgi:hypothetical protein
MQSAITQQATRRRPRAILASLLTACLLAATGTVAYLRHDEPGPPPLQATPTTLTAVLAGAAGGDTILLAPGDYGEFKGAAKPARVTIRPRDGATARMSLALSDATNLRLEGLTLASALIDGRTRGVTIARSRFLGQAVIRADRMRQAGIELEGNRFGAIDVCTKCYEGRLQVIGDAGSAAGIVIRGNVFGPGGASDGIQNGGNGVRIIDNTFVGIGQPGGGGRHVDALQLYGQRNTVVRGNYFRDVATAIMSPDGGDHERIEHNVFDTGAFPDAIMLGGDDGSIIRHNTMADLGGCISGQPCGTLLIGPGPTGKASHGTVVEDNILGQISLDGGSALAARRHNLVALGVQPGDLTGAPSFEGGLHPTSRAGFKLTSGSPGEKAASDGTDVGASVRGG